MSAPAYGDFVACVRFVTRRVAGVCARRPLCRIREGLPNVPQHVDRFDLHQRSAFASARGSRNMGFLWWMVRMASAGHLLARGDVASAWDSRPEDKAVVLAKSAAATKRRKP